jgi:hypothetical protein
MRHVHGLNDRSLDDFEAGPVPMTSAARHYSTRCSIGRKRSTTHRIRSAYRKL